MTSADQQTACEIAKAVSGRVASLIGDGYSEEDAVSTALAEYRDFCREMAAQNTERSRRLLAEYRDAALDDAYARIRGGVA